jgi:hypothetical protein
MQSFVLLLLVLGLASDVGAGPDAGIPLWAPRLRPDATLSGSYGMRKWGEGFLYEGPKFEARVAPDGTVSFKDRHLTEVEYPFSWVSKGRTKRPEPLPERTARDPSASRRAPWLPPPEQPQPSPRKIPQDELCPPNSSCYWRPLQSSIEVSGRFDLTDELVRALGKDPNALDKAHFLSATFEFRMRLAIEARKKVMREALDMLPKRLDELWADDRYSVREKRRILYELWVETDRTPDGEKAARMVDSFVRRRLPCGAPAGYTRAELDDFRARHPERPFSAADACEKLRPE